MKNEKKRMRDKRKRRKRRRGIEKIKAKATGKDSRETRARNRTGRKEET